jgi:hypothetical protein
MTVHFENIVSSRLFRDNRQQSLQIVETGWSAEFNDGCDETNIIREETRILFGNFTLYVVSIDK